MTSAAVAFPKLFWGAILYVCVDCLTFLNVILFGSYSIVTVVEKDKN